MEQRPEQVLDAARTEFCQRHLDRPLAAQHGVARGQERTRVVDAVPHRLGAGDPARQALDPLAFLRPQILTPSVERGRGDDPLHQRCRSG
jgi:hypothetical protein